MKPALNIEKLKTVYDRAAKRYDIQHQLLTAWSDQRGRRMVVKHTVRPGDHILDCGAGTGTTALLTARQIGPDGQVTLFDLSKGMLSVAREKAIANHLLPRLNFVTGDILELPFGDNSFDSALSTYSICPLYDPVKGALEIYRVVKPGGRIGIAHSTFPQHPFVKRLADKIENLVWKIPALSLGCRPVTVLPALEEAGAKVLFRKIIGVPTWPFIVFVIGKPLD